jgi:hypothetical protein
LYYRGLLYPGELHDAGRSRGIGPIGKGCCHGLELGRLARDSSLPKCMVDNVLLGGPRFSLEGAEINYSRI